MKEQYRFEITPDDKRTLFDVRALYDSRDLVLLLVKRNFITSYKQTLLGPLWVILHPLLTSLAYLFVFGTLAHLTTADVSGQTPIPAFLFYLSGTVCWNFFSGTVSDVSNTFSANARLMDKVYFPRIVIPFATALSRLISFFIQFALLLAAVCFAAAEGFRIRLTPRFLLLPLLLVLLMLLALGVGMAVTSLTVRYRDLKHLMSFIMQLWHYGTPVAYGLTLIPGAYRRLYLLNPVTVVITLFRRCLFGEGCFSPALTALSIALTLGIYTVGRLLYGKVGKNFADTV